MPASFGRCSQSRTPGSFVAMVPNGPRFSSGRFGFGSKVSIWLGPPVIQRRMTLLPLEAADFAMARCCNSAGSDSPATPASPAFRTLRRVASVNPSRIVGA